MARIPSPCLEERYGHSGGNRESRAASGVGVESSEGPGRRRQAEALAGAYERRTLAYEQRTHGDRLALARAAIRPARPLVAVQKEAQSNDRTEPYHRADATGWRRDQPYELDDSSDELGAGAD